MEARGGKKKLQRLSHSADDFREGEAKEMVGTSLTRKGKQAKFQALGTAGRSRVPEECLGGHMPGEHWQEGPANNPDAPLIRLLALLGADVVIAS